MKGLLMWNKHTSWGHCKHGPCSALLRGAKHGSSYCRKGTLGFALVVWGVGSI